MPWHVVVSCFAAAGGTAVTWVVHADSAGRVSHDAILLWRVPPLPHALLLAPAQTTFLDSDPAPFARYCLQTVGGLLAGLGTPSCGCGGVTDDPRDRWFTALDPVAGSWWVFGPGVYDGRGFGSLEDATAWEEKHRAAPADCNDDGAVNTLDFFDWLDAFFRGTAAAEWDGIRGVGTLDLYGFIGDFLRGE